MKLTKYEHACFVVEKDGSAIVVDPGEYTTDFVAPEHVVGIVITHLHEDHFSVEHIEQILRGSPAALIIGPSDVTAHLSQYTTRTVANGNSFAIEGFDLDFYGDDHAVIHADFPHPQNVGVLIEDRIYYPGDSLTMPEKSVDVLALPISAPWMKLSEAIEFMKAIGARLTFPSHDAILSHAGQQMSDKMIGSFADTAGTTYQRIDGETIIIE